MFHLDHWNDSIHRRLSLLYLPYDPLLQYSRHSLVLLETVQEELLQSTDFLFLSVNVLVFLRLLLPTESLAEERYLDVFRSESGEYVV